MTHRKVELTTAEMKGWGRAVEKKLVERMRRHGIPVIGLHKFRGVHSGVLRARTIGDKRIFEWWDTIAHARDDGVYPEGEPRFNYLQGMKL